MTTKPTGNLPSWSNGHSNETEPAAGKKTSGWANNEVPTAGNFNWLLMKLSEWVAYLSAIAGLHPEINPALSQRQFASPSGWKGDANMTFTVNDADYSVSVDSVAGSKGVVVGRIRVPIIGTVITGFRVLCHTTAGAQQLLCSLRKYTDAGSAFPDVLHLGVSGAGGEVVVPVNSGTSTWKTVSLVASSVDRTIPGASYIEFELMAPASNTAVVTVNLVSIDYDYSLIAPAN